MTAAMAGLAVPVTAAVPVFETSAPIAYMVDLSSGAVLWSKNANQRVPPASMAKMMTVYTAFRRVQAGRNRMDENYLMRPETWAFWSKAPMSSLMYIGVGEKVSVENLLHGVTTLSGNDASVMLAEGMAGSEARFATEMNREVARLGLIQSHFENATGWPDGGKSYSTAADLARLAQVTLYDFPQYYKDFYGKPHFAWGKSRQTGQAISQNNRNPLLGVVEGADGIKTGHTAEAGFGLTGSAERNGRRLILVMWGLKSESERAIETRRFMAWGFSAWQSHRLAGAGKEVGHVRVQQGNSATVALVTPRAVGVTLPAGDTRTAQSSITYIGPVAAPINKGQHIADLVVEIPGLPPQVTPLVAAKSVGKAGFFGRILAGLLSFLPA